MKVLMINTEFYRGGAAKIAQTLYQSLNEGNKVKCNFAYGRGEGVEDQKIFKFAFLPEIYFHAFLTRITGIEGIGSWFSTRRLEKYILREKFDLIHLHNLHGYYLNLSFIKFLKGLGIPIVWTLHDQWPITARCACPYDCEKWKWGCGKCPDLSLYPKSYLDSTALMWKKKRQYFASGWNPIIVCPSQWLADRVKGSYLGKYQVLVIPNAIDTEVFKPRNKGISCEKLGISSKKRVILIVSNDLKNKLKGIKYFFEALKNVKTDNWIVVTIGKRIKFNNKIKLNFKIKQLGYIKNKAILSALYNVSDIFFSCSLYEVFGLVITEALSSGIPIVGFRVGGVIEQVTDNCGILVNPGDVKALVKAIEKLLSDDELRINISKNCRERALQNYTIDKLTGSYIKIYKKVLGKE